jgi:hypothetical protein
MKNLNEKMQKKGENESKSGVNSGKFVANLKKQTQFMNGQNERKYLYERGLWRFSSFWAAKKQSQFKANSKPIQSQFGCFTAENAEYAEIFDV